MVTISPIRNEQDYQVALKRIDSLVDCADEGDQADELDVLSILVENYESEHYPVLPPDPIDAIKFRMEQMGMSEKEVAVYLDGEPMAEAVLNRRQPLTLAMIKRLHQQLHIPAESLLAY